MDLQQINKYIGKKVFFTLKNGFKYKIILKKDYLNGTSLCFNDKYGNPVSFDISEINFIIISWEDKNGF